MTSHLRKGMHFVTQPSETRDSISVVCDLLRRHSIKQIQLIRTPLAPKAQTRLADEPGVLPLLEHGAYLRSVESLPFWETVLLAAEKSEDGLPTVLANAAAFHQRVILDPDLSHPVDANLEAWMRSTVGQDDQPGVVAFLSRVITEDGSIKHFPMLDFAARTGHAGSVRSAREVISALGEPGHLLSSGRSFHFYGDRLLGDAELAGFLGRALLFAPLVDGRWIAHQLIGGACALRISSGRDGTLPTTV